MDSSVPAAELHAAWAGIKYAMQVLHLDRLIIEGNSATIISWISRFSVDLVSHPIVQDIRRLLQGCSSVLIRHIFKETNSAVDLVASFVAQHLNFILWSD